jgi:hypothetical protein
LSPYGDHDNSDDDFNLEEEEDNDDANDTLTRGNDTCAPQARNNKVNTTVPPNQNHVDELFDVLDDVHPLIDQHQNSNGDDGNSNNRQSLVTIPNIRDRDTDTFVDSFREL